MESLFEDRVVLVTGAGGGIGRAHARAFAAAGAQVVVNDPGVSLDGAGSSHAPADSVVAEIRAAGGEAVASYESVAEFDQAGAIVSGAIDAFGRLDVVVNNASVFHGCLFDELTREQWDAQLAVHVNGAFNICKHALPGMVERGWGRVVNTSSVSAFGGVGFAGYATAKAALLGFTSALASEYWRHGITVNAVLPNAGTPHRLEDGRIWMEKVASRGFAVPGGAGNAPPAPESVPPFVLFLASEAAAGISGRIFDVDGGRVGIYPFPAPAVDVTKPGGEGAVWTQQEIVDQVLPAIERLGLRAPDI